MVNPEDPSKLSNADADDALHNKDVDGDQSSAERIPLVCVQDPGNHVELPMDQEPEDSTVKKSGKAKAEFRGLTKEELQRFAENPFWHKLRWIFFALFWVIWVGMLVAVIVIIVVSPKCPPRPTRHFWQKPFYRLQVKSFAPAQGANSPDTVGSIEGLAAKMDYLRQTLGFSNFILDSLVAAKRVSGCPADFTAAGANSSSLEALKSLTKLGRKKGFTFLMEFDPSQADVTWFNDDSGKFLAEEHGNLSSRDSLPAVSVIGSLNLLHLPRGLCLSLNVSDPGVLARMESAMSTWLDTGLSGFVLTNVAFLMPSMNQTLVTGLSTIDWFAADPTPMLFSNASVEFVRSIRRFLTAQAEKRGRELALFVDPGNTGFPQPVARLAAYLEHPTEAAHAVVNTGLGAPLSPRSLRDPRPPGQLIVDSLAAAGPGSFLFPTAWPSLRRPGESYWTALSLLLPGVPCIYYGQELGMTHVPEVKLRRGLSSYLIGNDSTDPSETPMQWSGDVANAGWLSAPGNGTVPAPALAWVDLTARAGDIEVHNLRRLSSAGYPSSELQLVQRLVKLVTAKESLQWGHLILLKTPPEVVGFKRAAERFPAAVVVINTANKATTLSLTAESTVGTLMVMHSFATDAGSSYELDKDYNLERVYSPPKSILVFLEKE